MSGKVCPQTLGARVPIFVLFLRATLSKSFQNASRAEFDLIINIACMHFKDGSNAIFNF